MALLNAVVLNGGDAAIMLGIREQVRRALGDDAEFVVFDSQAPVARTYYPDVAFRLPASTALLRYPKVRYWGRIVREANQRRWLAGAVALRRAPWLARLLLRPNELRKLEEYARSDVAITTGGTYLVEHYSPWPRIFEFRLMLSLGKPLVFYTQSIGRFERDDYRRALRDVLSQAQLVLLRDDQSRRNIEDLGARPARAEVVADAALALAPDPDPEHAFRVPLGGPLRVALSVRYWPYFTSRERREAYERGLVELVTDLVRHHGGEVTFLSTCQGVPEYWTDDSRYAQDVAERLPDDVSSRVTVDRAFRTPVELMGELARYDLAICTRFHMAILALGAGTAALPISYEFKTREFFERVGLGPYVVDIEEADSAALCGQLGAFLQAAERWRPELIAGMGRELAAADHAQRLLGEAVGENGGHRA